MQKQAQNGDLTITYEIIKLLEENLGSTLFDKNLTNCFLDLSPQARKTEAKINKWNHIKLKSFNCKRNNEMKILPTEWKLFVNDISHKRLISKIYKYLFKLNI